MKTETGFFYFRGTSADTIRLHDEIRKAKINNPDLNNKQLSTICFCGVNVVERALYKVKK